MSDRIMSIEELTKMQGSFEEATKTDTPVAINTPTGNVVNGFPNKMGTTSPKDYHLVLYLPVNEKTNLDEVTLSEDGMFYRQDVTARQKEITLSKSRRVRNYATIIAMAFTEFREDGDTNLYTAEDILKVYELFDDEVIDACEKLVSTVLDIPSSLAQHITDVSLMQNCSLILQNNPSFFQNGEL